MTTRSEVPDTPIQQDPNAGPSLVDSYARVAKKLRIQVTDRCNFSCDFCMPPDPVWLAQSEILTFDEMARVSRILARMGVEKIRLSGGEPLVRREIEKLVGLLVKVPGIKSVNLTTNGSMLKRKARVLKENGLNGVTVSLHSLRAERYEAITGAKNMLSRVLEGIDEAKRAGLQLKINCVVTRGSNEDEVLDFVELAREWEVPMRFIEYMPFDGQKLWDAGRVVTGAEITKKITAAHNLIPLPREIGATADTYGFSDGSRGEVGTITSMTKPFCGDCDRIRLTADGKIVPCLFSRDEYDVRAILRRGASDDEISSFIRKCFWLKSEGVEAMLRQKVEFKRIRPMHTIGG